jgi:hypothetical protein
MTFQTGSQKLLQFHHSLPSLPLRSLMEQHRKLVVFCLGVLGGGVMGLWHSDWQVAVEPAQVIAGLVKYSPNNPFYIYQTKTWTILHQLAALGLRLGLSEGKLSLILSLLAGGVAFAGLALWTLAFSESIPLAVLVPFYVFLITVDWGINYPLIVLGQSHTYGMLGLSSIFLATALLGVGEFGWGAFVFGLAPAIHPSLGAWGILIVLICVAWDYATLRPQLPRMIRFGLAGGLITLASLVFHFLVTYHAPQIDPALAQRYLSTFIHAWDEHRLPLNFSALQTLLAVMTGVISLTGLQFLKPTLPVHALFLLRSLLVSSALSLGLALINQFGFQLPEAVLVLMPTRLLNFNNLAYLPLLLGLLWRYRANAWVLANLLLALLAMYFFAALAEDLKRLFILSGIAFVLSFAWSHGPLSWLLGYVSVALVLQPVKLFPSPGLLLALSFLVLGFCLRMFPPRTYLRALLNLLPIAMLGLNSAIAVAQAYALRSNVSDLWNAKPLLAEISPSDGLLLTGTGLHLIQLLSRRPILLDTDALDILPYAPEGGPEFERILRDAYGIDFFTSAPGRAKLEIEPTKTLWESWAPADWARIRNEFNITQVITSADWRLQLPPIRHTSGGLILYQIPESGS